MAQTPAPSDPITLAKLPRVEISIEAPVSLPPLRAGSAPAGLPLAPPLESSPCHLPDERRAIIHQFSVAGKTGYLTVGLNEDGRPGEIFIQMAKPGSTVNSLLAAFALSTSLAFQSGVALEAFVEKFLNTRFDPAGATTNPALPEARSVIDYIARWLGLKFLSPGRQRALGLWRETVPSSDQGTRPGQTQEEPGSEEGGEDLLVCLNCGLTVREKEASCSACRSLLIA